MDDAMKEFNRRFAQLTPEQQEHAIFLMDTMFDALDKLNRPPFKNGGVPAGPNLKPQGIEHWEPSDWMVDQDSINRIENLTLRAKDVPKIEAEMSDVFNKAYDAVTPLLLQAKSEVEKEALADFYTKHPELKGRSLDSLGLMIRFDVSEIEGNKPILIRAFIEPI